jgi:hypothetical protein
MRELEQRALIGGQLVGGVSQHLRQTRREPEPVGFDVDFEHPILGAADCPLEPTLGFLELTLRALVLLDLPPQRLFLARQPEFA